MRHDEADPVQLLCRQIKILIKLTCQNISFRLLCFPVCVSILSPAERAGDVMCYCRKFQRLLRLFIKSFGQSDDMRKSPYFHKMIDIMKPDITFLFVEMNHLHCGSLDHLRHLLSPH